jgi:protein-disulfide isomerase
MQGAALSTVQDSIRVFLGRQRETAARAELVAELRASGPPVRLAIDPPRLTVEVTKVDPVQGPETALVTVEEYSDFQCPFCNRVTPTLKRLRETYGDQIRIVWKDFPIASIHPQAQQAAEAAHCAGDQDSYWEYHDRIFANQSALDVDDLKEHAVAIGIDADLFDGCLDSGRHADRVREGIEGGVALGVDSTPTLFVNGRRVAGAQPYEVFESLVEDELTRAGR